MAELDDVSLLTRQWAALVECFGEWEAELATAQQQADRVLGPPPHITAENIAQAGWALLLPAGPSTDLEEAVLEALQPLITARSSQLGFRPRVLHYQPGDTVSSFLWREGPEVIVGNMRVQKIPYYLCLVGSPERIPWDFQSMLSDTYAVGRIWFDNPDDAARSQVCIFVGLAFQTFSSLDNSFKRCQARYGSMSR